ncbi:MAG TPA: hypothetical protein VKH35_08935 [Thermoanaerobaculia bacterium]|jgi:hypothetical protein|nr:hypothetical protein [Thermoanaerobaculia bacterium]
MRVFRNSAPLELATSTYAEALGALDLSEFPTIGDFAIELSDSEEFGQHVQFVSPSHGELAGFPYWDNVDRDMRHFVAEDVPLGSIGEPVDDADVDWQIVIFEHAGFVYVLEGSAPHATEFDVWFRVPRDRYIAEWARVIDQFNPVEPLAP